MAKVEIYTSKLCGFCHSAKRLLKSKNVAFDETDVSFSASKKGDMIARANGSRTVPQIFINDQHIGGCDDLYALEQAGKLDKMLAA